MRVRHLLLVGAFVVAAASLPVHRALAQSTVDVIRGTIYGADKKPLENVTVTATSIALNVNRPQKTDKNGKFTITFPDGGGDYWISLAAIGYNAKRFELKRNIDEDVLTITETMSQNVVTLKAVNTNADRQRPGRNDNGADVGGTTRSVDMSMLSLDQMGDMAAMGAMLPGMSFIPGQDGTANGISVLGLSADQNSFLVNGLPGSQSLPADAQVSTYATTSQYDGSGGRGAGAIFQSTLGAGSNIVRQVGRFTGDAPSLQFTDPVGRAGNGILYSKELAGGGFSGPIKYDKIFYATSYTVSRQYSDLHTLLNASPATLQAAGISADSVTRLLALAGPAGIPTSFSAIPGSNVTTSAGFTNAINFNPPSPTSGQSYNLGFVGNYSSTAPGYSQLTTSIPTRGADVSRWYGSVTSRATGYFGFVLSETNLGINQSRSFSNPYLTIPGGSVLVNSTFPNAAAGVAYLGIGGGSSYSSSDVTNITFTNLLRWFSSDNTHSFKLKTEVYQDDFSANSFSNEYGTFSYNSLSDLQSGTPASFTRNLTPRVQNVSQLAYGGWLGDSWRPTSNFQMVFGSRLDANHLDDQPVVDPAIEQTFGLHNEYVPDKAYVSPRVGFSWVYGTAPTIATFIGSAAVPRAKVSGGIGYFQNMASSSTLLSSIISNTGLASSAQQITCIGLAAPTPDWSDYVTHPEDIPTQCEGGTSGTVFANTSPNVYVYDPSYMQSRRLSGNLQWSGPVLWNTLNATVNETYARNQHQQSSIDVNFNPTVRFTLADEGGRPVYVNPSSIVPSTGLVSTADSRVSTAFNTVTELRSDAIANDEYLTLQLTPVQYSAVYSWGVYYSFQSLRDRQNGFNGTTSGNPLTQQWGDASGDYHHLIQGFGSYNWSNAVTFQANVNLQSPTLYTPVVANDINGDGSVDDRAFVFDPAKTTDPEVQSGMIALLQSGSSSIRQCLISQLGQIAGRNSCAGPWTVTFSSLTIRLNPQRFRLSQRTSLSLSIANPAAGADLLLHGDDHLHGWGEAAFPQQTLLYVRGFDQSKDQFLYTVNPRFGSTSLSQSTFRNPTRLTVVFSYNIGPAFERQTLLQGLDHGRTTTGTKYPEGTIKSIVSNGIVDPLSAILRASDSLKLTTVQADSISTLNRYFTTRQDSIWAPIAQYLAALPDHYNDDDAYKHYQVGREATVDLLLAIGPKINDILTPAQRRMLPAQAAQWLDPHFLKLVRSSTISPP